MDKYRRWCYTHNNYTAELEIAYQGIPGTRYHVYGREIAPSTGTPHLQGFIIFRNARTFSSLHNMFPAAHWSVAEHPSEVCARYCKKEGSFWESGVEPKDPGRGEKERWALARRAATRGDWAAIPDDIFVRYYGNLKRIADDSMPRPASIETLDFHWFWGDTGTGKSREAREKNPGYYVKGINKWWDGYNGTSCVIIEEWGPMEPGVERAMGALLKQWCDHHPFHAEVKGGSRMLRPPKIIITSNWRLEDCFHDEQILEPLKRRLKIHHFFRPFTVTCSPTQPQRPPSPPPSPSPNQEDEYPQLSPSLLSLL